MTYTDNILSTFNRASRDDLIAGEEWYSRANVLAWELGGANYKRAAGVIAALSPLLSWEKNKQYARLVMELRNYSIADVESYVPTLRGSARKALRIANGERPEAVLGGLKVTAFYDCIANPFTTQHVCIDTHAMYIALGQTDLYHSAPKLGKGAYSEFAGAYVDAAAIAGVAPSTMQAITWITHRRLKNAR